MGLLTKILDESAGGLERGSRTFIRAVRDLTNSGIPKEQAEQLVLGNIPDDMAGWTPERVSNAINSLSSITGEQNKGGVAWVNPQDFVNSNALNPQGIKDQTRPFDYNWLASSADRGVDDATPFLNISDGQIVGHEGRHRMQTLANEGITRAPVMVRNVEGYSPNVSGMNPFDTTLTGATKSSVGSFDTGNLQDLKIYDYVQASPDNEQKINSMMRGLLYANAGKSNVATTAAEEAAEYARRIQQGYPESVAKRIASGELPMDNASRMQRAIDQRFNVDNTLYRGLGDPYQEGAGTKASTWATGDKAWASDYALQNADTGANVMPVFAKSDNPINFGFRTSMTEVKPDEMAQRVSRRIMDQLQSGKLTEDQAMKADDAVWEWYDSMGEADKRTYWPVYTYWNRDKNFVDVLKKAGFDSIDDAEFSNLHFAGPPDIKTLGLLDDRQLKSINAAFDPEYTGPNILGANAGKSNAVTTAAEQASEPLRELMFLHNTSPDKLQRFQEMGGMPMPSIGVTKKDIPFEGYGDITLLGRPSSFDPAIRGNTAWNADAYTVRAPSPVQMAKKGSFKQLDNDFYEFRDVGNVDHARQMLANLQTKGSLNEYEYNDFMRFMEDSPAVKAKWLRDVKGVELPVDKNGKLDRYAISDLIRDNDAEFRAWAASKSQDYFEPEKYLITNPNRDYYSSRASLKPYTAENVTAFMKKFKGTAQEGSMTTAGTGANRAATAKQLKSLDAMRSEKGLLASREAVAVDKNTFSMMQDDLMEALKPYYQYDADGWRYLNEAGEMLVATDKKGMDKAMREYGFENVPDSLKQEIRDWKDSMRSAKTEYFESKPERVVGLNEFGGAIVPENTPQGILDMLTRQGVRVEKYVDEAQRTALRNKFDDLMFVRPETAVASGLLASAPELNTSGIGADTIQDPARQAASQRFTEMGLNPDAEYSYASLLPIKRAISSDERESDVLGGYRPAVPSLLRELMYQYLLAEESAKRGEDKQAIEASTNFLF